MPLLPLASISPIGPSSSSSPSALTKTSVSGSMIRVPHSTFRRQPRTRRINDLSSRRSRTTITIHTAMTRAMYSLACQPPHRSVFHCKECRRLSSARYGAGGLTCFCLVRLFVFITVINTLFLARYYFNPRRSHYFFAPSLWSHMGRDRNFSSLEMLEKIYRNLFYPIGYNTS